MLNPKAGRPRKPKPPIVKIWVLGEKESLIGSWHWTIPQKDDQFVHKALCYRVITRSFDVTENTIIVYLQYANAV